MYFQFFSHWSKPRFVDLRSDVQTIEQWAELQGKHIDTLYGFAFFKILKCCENEQIPYNREACLRRSGKVRTCRREEAELALLTCSVEIEPGMTAHPTSCRSCCSNRTSVHFAELAGRRNQHLHGNELKSQWAYPMAILWLEFFHSFM